MGIIVEFNMELQTKLQNFRRALRDISVSTCDEIHEYIILEPFPIFFFQVTGYKSDRDGIRIGSLLGTNNPRPRTIAL